MNQSVMNQSVRDSLLNKTQSIKSSDLVRSSSMGQYPQVISLSSTNNIDRAVLQAINDSSHPPLKKKKIYDYVADTTSKFKIIPPENKYLLMWHGVIIFIILYYYFEVGLLLGYGEPVWNDILNYLIPVNIIFIICLTFDGVLSLFKAYYFKGLLIKNHRLIAKRYIPKYLIIDVVAIISITIPFATTYFVLNWIKLLFLPKIITLYAIDKQYIRITQLSIKIHTLYLLSRLVLLLILGSHFLGIFFYMIDYYVYSTNYYGPNTPNLCWIYNAAAFSEMVLLLPWYGQYEYTMYYSIGTMTTIAYGDITPLNPLQTMYTIFALLVYTVCFAYILSEVLRILMEAQASKFEHTNTLLIITNMMRDKMISEKVQVKVRSFYEKMWKEEVYRNRAIQQQLIDRLPQKIKNDLFEQLYLEMFESMGFSTFVDHKNWIQTDFMVSFTNSIREQRLVEGHLLYKENEKFNFDEEQSHCLFFIKKSSKNKQVAQQSIEIAVNNKIDINKITICKLSDGIFGYEEFLTGDSRGHEAIILQSVISYKISRKQFLVATALANELERQNIFIVSEKITNNLCYICREKDDHQFRRCPYVTYQPDKYKVIMNMKYSNKNQNKDKNDVEQKKKKYKLNALTNYKNLRDNPYKIKDKYQMLVSIPYYRKLIHSPLKKSKSMNVSLRSTQNKFNPKTSKFAQNLEDNVQESIIMDNKVDKKGISSLMEGLAIKQVESEEQINEDEEILESGSQHGEQKSGHLRNPIKRGNQRIKGEQFDSNIFNDDEPEPATRPFKKTEEYGSNIFDQQQQQPYFHKSRPAPIKPINPFLSQIQDQSQQYSKNKPSGRFPVRNYKSLGGSSSSSSSYFDSSSSSSNSSGSSQELDNYMKETQRYIAHLQQEEHNQNIKKSIKNRIQTNLKMSKSAFLMNLNNINRMKLKQEPNKQQGRMLETSFIRRDEKEDLKQSIRAEVKNTIVESIKGFLHKQKPHEQNLSNYKDLSYIEQKLQGEQSYYEQKSSPIMQRSLFLNKLSGKQSASYHSEDESQQKRDENKLPMNEIKLIIDQEFDKVNLEDQIDQVRQIEQIYMKNALYLASYHPTDTIKQYSLYRPDFNITHIIQEYNQLQGLTKKRRKIQNIQPIIKQQ